MTTPIKFVKSTLPEDTRRIAPASSDETAAAERAAGGGGAAAIIGATGAALIGMVANFTIGKKGYEEVDEEFKEMLEKSEKLRSKLTDAIKDDVDVFNKVMAAYGMPKETAEEKQKRTEGIQAALKEATDQPLPCAKHSHQNNG